MPRIGLGIKLELPNTSVVMGSTGPPAGALIMLLPSSIANSGGFVTQWTDVSGNSRDYDPYSGSTPSAVVPYSATGFNGGPCVDATSVGYMRREFGHNIADTGELTYSAVYDLGGTDIYVVVDWADTIRTIVTSTTLQANERHGGDVVIMTTGAVSTALRLIITLNRLTGNGAMYVNGSSVSTSTAVTKTHILQSNGSLGHNTFGARSDGADRANIKMAALCAYDRDMTASGEVAALDNYLISQCGF